jgi:hypothetical protein
MTVALLRFENDYDFRIQRVKSHDMRNVILVAHF